MFYIHTVVYKNASCVTIIRWGHETESEYGGHGKSWRGKVVGGNDVNVVLMVEILKINKIKW